MNIDINVYRARVGGFTSLSRRTKCKNIDRCSVSEVFLYILVIYFENFRSAIASWYHLFALLTTAILITCFVFVWGFSSLTHVFHLDQVPLVALFSSHGNSQILLFYLPALFKYYS